MSFKTGGLKTKFMPLTYGYEPNRSYTIYAALESCSDIMVYRMIDDNDGEEIDISLGTEDDCAHGSESLIDVMYTLKHNGVGTYPSGVSYCQDIVIEEMTPEEMERVFKNMCIYRKTIKVKL